MHVYILQLGQIKYFRLRILYPVEYLSTNIDTKYRKIDRPGIYV